MSGSFNGVGTKFYGKRDFKADGTYVTTEWVILLFIPIIPFRSLRVNYRGESGGSWKVENYGVHETMLPNWKQVISIYAFLAIVFAWSWFVCSEFAWLEKKAGITAALWVSFFAFGVPSPIPLILRHLKRKKAHMEES